MYVCTLYVCVCEFVCVLVSEFLISLEAWGKLVSVCAIVNAS